MEHVLIVDNDCDICDVLQIGFETDGLYRTTRAADAEEVSRVVMRDPPNAAIVDALLRGSSGLALARRLLDHGIPVLIMTGETEHQRRLSRAGCHFVAKPFRIARLLAETQLLLEGAERRKADLAAGLDRVLDGGRVPANAHGRIERARRVRPVRQPHAALLDLLVGEAIALTGADMGTLQRTEDASRVLRIVASRGFDERYLRFFAEVRGSHDSASSVAFLQARRVVVPDVERSAVFAGKPSREILREAGVLALQSTPIFGRAGRIIGMIATHRRSVWLPSDDQLRSLGSIIDRAAQELEAA